MFKAMCRILAISTIFLIAVNAMARDLPKGAWWTEPSVIKTLNLSNNEVTQLEEAFAEWRLNIGLLKGEIQVSQHKINEWMARNSSNPQGKERIIRKLRGKIEKARSLLPKTKPAYVDKVRAILGPARFETLVDLEP